ncbi:MAG: hypothetical protein GXP25_00315 [Planctomycetes bacterium]|nr:hypothetical protein [Planctomycetota bacterium]
MATTDFGIAYVLLLAIAATVVADGGEVAKKAENLHKVIWGKFVHPKTHVVRTRVRGTGGSPWGSELEDTSLSGGMYLAAMVDRFDVTKSPDHAEEARKIFGGLLLNATCAEPGFIARGAKPDGKGFLGAPSVDQYTGLLYGLWRYYGSAIATDAEKEQVRKVYADCLTRLERHKFTILDSDGKTPTKFGHLSSVRPTRSERLLSFLLVGWRLTGDKHWFDVYEQMKKPRLETCRKFPDYNAWVLVQSALSLHMLVETEERPEVRKVYEEGFASCVRHCRKQVPAYRDYVDSGGKKETVKTFRNPIEGITTILLSGDGEASKEIVQPLKDILMATDPGTHGNSVSLCSLEWDYWLAVKKGLIPR